MIFNTFNTRRLLQAGFALSAMLLAISTSVAQEPNDILWGNTGTGDWNVGTNWPQFSAVPQADTFNEHAIINNGGTAFIDSTVAAGPGAIELGDAEAMGGTLEIRDGGSITVINNGVTSGDVLVGNGDQDGTVTIDRGGSLTAELFSTFNTGGSSVTLGGGAGSGMATLNTTALTLRSDFRVIGPNVAINTSNLLFGGATNLIAEITGPTHSIIDVNGFARTNGTLTLDFNGVTPSVGDSWTIIDAQAVAGGFTQVTTTASLGPGTAFVQRSAAGGNGQLISASLEEVLTLKVNRNTGGATLVSESGSAVDLSGYDVVSGSGLLDTGWNSLADQSVGSFQEASPTVNNLSELDPNGTTSVNATGFNLGTAYAPQNAPFGSPIPDDLSFTYRNGSGELTTGIVEYEGDAVANTLVLTIDPTTGNARLENDSLTDLDLDVYTITSAEGSLLTSWDSLQDQGTGNWQEANPSTERLSELEPTGVLSLSAGGGVNLDGLWNITGTQDAADLGLTFRDANLGTFNGIVQFEALGAGVIGDYNDNGVVDAADYTVWRDALGTGATLPNDATPGIVDTTDYAIWKLNFGMSAGSGAGSAVPEPAAWLLLMPFAAAVLLLTQRTHRLAPGGIVQTSRQVADSSTKQVNKRNYAMGMRLLVTGFAAFLLGNAAQAQPVTITGADTMNLNAPFTDGSITISPFGAGGVAGSFGPNGTFIGPLGGTNDNAVDDADGDPSTTDDAERLDITLGSGVGLTQIEFGFSRANPILLTGFGSDPLASFGSNPGGQNVLTYDSGSGSLAIFHPFFGGDRTVINFANTAATDGQTISSSVLDYNQGAPQLAFTSFTYDTSSVLTPGDVDGLNGVTIDDFNLIRDNFRSGTTRAEGDLTGDGIVSLADFDQWAANFPGSSSGLASQLAVPEPSSILLAAFSLLAVGRRKR